MHAPRRTTSPPQCTPTRARRVHRPSNCDGTTCLQCRPQAPAHPQGNRQRYRTLPCFATAWGNWNSPDTAGQDASKLVQPVGQNPAPMEARSVGEHRISDAKVRPEDSNSAGLRPLSGRQIGDLNVRRVECRCSPCSGDRQQCTIDLTVKLDDRQCEALPSLRIVSSRAALGHGLHLPTSASEDALLSTGAPITADFAELRLTRFTATSTISRPWVEERVGHGVPVAPGRGVSNSNVARCRALVAVADHDLACNTTGTVDGVTDTVARYFTFTSGKACRVNRRTMSVRKRVHNSSAR